MGRRKYKIYGNNKQWIVYGLDREDAMFELKNITGMSIDFIKKTFYIERIYD